MTDIEAFLREARAAYVASNRDTLEWVLQRGPSRGGFLDTKVNSITLKNYDSSDGWRCPDYLYGWIQGRGLEALVTHAEFFATEDPAFAARLDAAARALYGVLAPLYDRYSAAYFCHDAALTPIRRDSDGQPTPQELGTPYFTYSDAFVLKGLIAATTRYDPARRAPYLAKMAALVQAIETGRFIGDEQQPLTAATAQAQEAEFGPRMIVLAAASLLERLGLHEEARFGERFITHVLDKHWDHDGAKPSHLIRDAEGGDRCNVGHAIEFAGFAFEYLPEPAPDTTFTAIRQALLASFDAGFSGPGLCLHVSAASGAPQSDYFPWWSLPETVRAASLCYLRQPDAAVLAAWQQSHAAFFANYWRGTPPLAYQTRDRNGPVDFVPATPDLDPGYHTGLSFLGAIQAIDRLLA